MKLFLISITVCTIAGHLQAAEEPQDLTRLREKYVDAANLAVTPITKVYIREIKSLRTDYQGRNDNEKLAFIVAEIERIEQLDGKGLVHLEPNEAIAAISPLEEQMIRLKGLWRNKENSHYEFQLPDIMTQTQTYGSSGGGTTVQTTEYKVTMAAQKLVIEQVGAENPQYKTWYEARLPLSLENMSLDSFNISPGRKSNSTVQLTRAQAVASASVWHMDSVGAICDGVSPEKSDDYTVPRQTWHPTKGSNEWVQLDFPAPRKVSESSVYWFDDVKNGGACHIPEAAHIFYKSGDEWKPVVTKRKLSVSKDEWNKVRFEEVETTALRLQVQMHEKYSAGVLEWTFE